MEKARLVKKLSSKFPRRVFKRWLLTLKGSELLAGAQRTGKLYLFLRGPSEIYQATKDIPNWKIVKGDYFYSDISHDGDHIEIFNKDGAKDSQGNDLGRTAKDVRNFNGTRQADKKKQALGYKKSRGDWTYDEESLRDIKEEIEQKYRKNKENKMNENADEKFCCEGVQKLSEGHYYFVPLSRRPESNDCGLMGYGFAHRQIRYCPSCGALLKNGSRSILPQPDNPDFCCWTMESNANVSDYHDKFEIFYQSWIRRYFFSISTDWRIRDPEWTIFQEWDFYYCLYCGKKLPESLLDVWLETVEKEFGVARQEPFEKMLPSLPEEFKTDVWWKKRGL